MFCPPGYRPATDLSDVARLASRERILDLAGFFEKGEVETPDLSDAALSIRYRAYAVWLQFALFETRPVKLFMCSPKGEVLSAVPQLGRRRSPNLIESLRFVVLKKQIFFPIGVSEEADGFRNSVEECASFVKKYERDAFDFLNPNYWIVRQYPRPNLWLYTIYEDVLGSISSWLTSRLGLRSNLFYSRRKADRRFLLPFVGWSICYREEDHPESASAFERLFVNFGADELVSGAHPDNENPSKLIEVIEAPRDFSEAAIARWIVHNLDSGLFSKRQDARDQLSDEIGERAFLRAWSRARETRPEIGKGGRKPTRKDDC